MLGEQGRTPCWDQTLRRQVTCVRGVYLFFCACLQKDAGKNTEPFYKAFGQGRACFKAVVTPPHRLNLSRAVAAYLEVLLLVRIRVHKHTQTSKVVHISEDRTCKTTQTQGISTTAGTPGPAALTFLHAFLAVPNGQTITVQVLLSLTVNFEVHLHLPVFQMTRLEKHARKRRQQADVLACFHCKVHELA